MRKEKKIKIGFTIGDLNGVGGELIIKTFEDKRLLDFFTPVVYASMKSMSFLKQHFQSSILFNEIPNANTREIPANARPKFLAFSAG